MILGDLVFHFVGNEVPLGGTISPPSKTNKVPDHRIGILEAVDVTAGRVRVHNMNRWISSGKKNGNI